MYTSFSQTTCGLSSGLQRFSISTESQPLTDKFRAEWTRHTNPNKTWICFISPSQPDLHAYLQSYFTPLCIYWATTLNVAQTTLQWWPQITAGGQVDRMICCVNLEVFHIDWFVWCRHTYTQWTTLLLVQYMLVWNEKKECATLLHGSIILCQICLPQKCSHPFYYKMYIYQLHTTVISHLYLSCVDGNDSLASSYLIVRIEAVKEL